jgi:hypothetical protein
MGVKPYEADVIPVIPKMRGDGPKGAYRDGMVAAEDNRRLTISEDSRNGGKNILKGREHLNEVLWILVLVGHTFGANDLNVTMV